MCMLFFSARLSERFQVSNSKLLFILIKKKKRIVVYYNFKLQRDMLNKDVFFSFLFILNFLKCAYLYPP